MKKDKKIIPVKPDKPDADKKEAGWFYTRNLYLHGDAGQPVNAVDMADTKTFKLFKELGYITQK